jgi:hypothetical protein
VVEEGLRVLTTEVLLAGFGGAVAVFVLGAFREWWREEREREGLLRMLLAEVEHNSVVVHTISETTRDLLSSPDLPFVQLEAWHDVRERAAALLPNELIGSLNDYYATLQTLLSLRQFSNLANERMNREIRRAAGELLGRKYCFPQPVRRVYECDSEYAGRGTKPDHRVPRTSVG